MAVCAVLSDLRTTIYAVTYTAFAVILTTVSVVWKSMAEIEDLQFLQRWFDYKRTTTRKIFPFDYVIISNASLYIFTYCLIMRNVMFYIHVPRKFGLTLLCNISDMFDWPTQIVDINHFMENLYASWMVKRRGNTDGDIQRFSADVLNFYLTNFCWKPSVFRLPCNP